MKIVITGALGHIGSRLIHDLPTDFEEAEIVLLDNLSSQRYCSLFNLPPRHHYRFIEADVLDADLNDIFSDADVVIHLAAITNAAGSFEIKDQVETVNYIGTKKVANACVATGSALVFLSTTSIYGTQKETVDENCTASDLKPQSPYAESKLKAEQYLQILGSEDGLRFIVCRFGTIFGAAIGMRFHTAINKFCWQASNGLPITVWRTALDQKRPYLHLIDAINAIQFILNKNLFDNQIYNVLTLNASVRQITDIINRYVHDINIQFVDTAIMNQLSYNVLNDKFREQGFIFQGNLEKGISEILDLLQGLHYRANQ
jgi:nucleoside-diphosphate-sugar epimerase